MCREQQTCFQALRHRSNTWRVLALWLLHKEWQQAWRGRVCTGGAAAADGIFDDDAHLVRVMTVMRHMSLIM